MMEVVHQVVVAMTIVLPVIVAKPEILSKYKNLIEQIDGIK